MVFHCYVCTTSPSVCKLLEKTATQELKLCGKTVNMYYKLINCCTSLHNNANMDKINMVNEYFRPNRVK